MNAAFISSAIYEAEGLQYPKKVVRIYLSRDFYIELTRSSASNGNFSVSATGPQSLENLFLGKPYEIREQLSDFELKLE